ncbi:MAG: NUDIX hydrolase [Gemmataceae bacterium]|nr:NUDIX hydrolase [Gemmataceae bacterium]
MANDADFVRQAAALPLRNGRVCLVTSSNGKRWVIPKGLIEPGQTAGETALQEAWEEAGLVGVLQAEPIGSYVYEKWCGKCHVTVFVMHVTEIAQAWPERDLRQRVWLGPMGAIERIEDPGLVDLVRLATGKHTRDKVVLGH